MDDWIFLLTTVLKSPLVIVPLLGAVAYYTWLERKVIGYMQARVGPNRTGARGIGQPIADALKLLFKELLIPAKSNTFIFVIAPILSLAPAIAAWAVVPFADGWVVADINAGVLYLFAMTSLGAYGVLMSGWGSNSRYAFLGAMRSAAQIISYEIAMGFALVGVLMAAGSMNMSAIEGVVWFHPTLVFRHYRRCLSSTGLLQQKLIGHHLMLLKANQRLSQVFMLNTLVWVLLYSRQNMQI